MAPFQGFPLAVLGLYRVSSFGINGFGGRDSFVVYGLEEDQSELKKLRIYGPSVTFPEGPCTQ